MKPATVKRLEEALFGGLREAGVQLSSEARSFAAWLIGTERFQRVSELPGEQFLVGVVVGAFLTQCKSAPEPSEEQLTQMLQQIPALVYQMRSGVLGEVAVFAKQLPRKRGGGPKPKLATPAEKNQACSQIGALIGNKVKTSEAIARVARAARNGEGVSYRTMQRIWLGRPY